MDFVSPWVIIGSKSTLASPSQQSSSTQRQPASNCCLRVRLVGWAVFCRLRNSEPRKNKKLHHCTCTSPHWTCHRTASRSDKSCGTSWCSTWCTNQVIQQDFQVLQNIDIDNKRCTCTKVGPCLGRGQADPWEQEHYRQTSCISPTLPKRQTLCTEPILPEFQAQSWRWGINECHQEIINLNLFQLKMSVLSEVMTRKYDLA